MLIRPPPVSQTHNDFFSAELTKRGVPVGRYGWASLQGDGGVAAVKAKAAAYFSPLLDGEHVSFYGYSNSVCPGMYVCVCVYIYIYLYIYIHIYIQPQPISRPYWTESMWVFMDTQTRFTPECMCVSVCIYISIYIYIHIYIYIYIYICIYIYIYIYKVAAYFSPLLDGERVSL